MRTLQLELASKIRRMFQCCRAVVGGRDSVGGVPLHMSMTPFSPIRELYPIEY